jgi:hypothetical protein
VPRNVLEGGTLRVRVGDSVMFTAAPQDATNGTVHVQVGEGAFQTTELADGDPIIHTFTQAGTFQVSASHTDTSTTTGGMTIEVLGGGFPAIPASCMINQTRAWACPELPASVFLDASPSVEASRTATGLNIRARSTNRRHVILARLEENGPILAATDIKPFWVQAAVDNYMRLVARYNDYNVWENTIVTRNLPENVDLLIQMYVAGVMLDDMTLERWVRHSDLDDLGSYTFRLLRSPGINVAACHTIKMYQDGQFIGEAYYSGRLFIDE